MSLNLGKIQVGQSGALNQVSYGNQSPADDAVPLSWNAGDFRFYIGTNRNIIGWRCTVGGTPGTWVQLSTNQFDLYLSYGNQNADGALPLPPEATPSFYLRPNTDKTCQMSFSGSPGAIWEYPVCLNSPLLGDLEFDTFVYSCGLSAGGGTPTCEFIMTVNGAPIITTGNMDGLTNTLIQKSLTGIGLSPGDRVGVHCVTTNLSSGFLMATTHIHVGS